MKQKFLFFLFLLAAGGGGVFYHQWKKQQKVAEESSAQEISQKIDSSSPVQKNFTEEIDPLHEELEALSQDVIRNIKTEMKLNLDMIAQLRTYKKMLHQLQNYSHKVEKEIALIQEITRDEFKDNVALQAELFKGKKPVLIAKHLREFSPVRAGAILSKMREKEASQVLDAWASTDSEFYRATVEAYLKNKRQEMHPELFTTFMD